MDSKKIAGIALAGAITACCAVTPAHAASQLLPGLSTGLPLGLPLPPGVWDVTQGSYGFRNSDPQTDVGVGVPSWLIWSTPWTLAGGRLMFDTVTALADVDVKKTVHSFGVGNTYLDAQLKWNLGDGFNFGLQSGVFLPVHNSLTDLGVTRDFFSYMEIASMTYEHNGWELTSTGIYGTGRNGDTLGLNAAPSWFNYDLSAIRNVGHWEFGAVGFGSSDLSTPVAGYAKQSQFAAGGLIGYHLGKDTLQLKLTRDIAERNYGGRETRVWFNLIIPLWMQQS